MAVISQFLENAISYLKGVGPQRAETLNKELGVHTYRDLLFYFPYRYVDKTQFYKVNQITAKNTHVQVKGILSPFKLIGQGRSKRLVASLKDDTGQVQLVWFKGHQWIKKILAPGKEYVVFGKPNLFKGQVNIAHPEMDLSNEYESEQTIKMQPIYNSSEIAKKKGLDTKAISKLTYNLVSELKQNDVLENLSEEVIDKYQLISRYQALKSIHFPSSDQAMTDAIRRLKFEELFFIQLKLLRLKVNRQSKLKGFEFDVLGTFFNEFYDTKLPFELTNAQKRVLKEIRQDVKSGRQMNRLLQGDVGSGKTMVALLSMLMALDNGFQAAIMAPTEILAQQHYQSIQELLYGMNINVALLTGSVKTSEKQNILERLKLGDIHILIGTHALIEDPVKFKNLGLAVIDEQHRFGVAQRARLWKKNTTPPHILVMTATPIPRTLAMTLYADLETSIIDELPPGRKSIQTEHRYDSHRLRIFGFIREQIKLGRQVYIVYPLIKESEKLDYKDLMDGYESVVREFPLPDYKISIVHGQMKPEDKEYEMRRFVNGETNIMVATTVIEVGVNVPNASVMIIESAERFGLSQLHQLRGRVGRGAEQSYCILVTGNKLSKEARERLKTMVRTNDGFEIAEVDLKLRGPGDMEGIQQSGVVDLRVADLVKDVRILQEARQTAIDILEEDPELVTGKNNPLKNYLDQKRTQKIGWSKIS